MTESLRELILLGMNWGPYALAVAAALVWSALALVAPEMLMWSIVLTLAVFPSSSLLIAEGGIGFDIYGKGSGTLFFSIYEITIMVTAGAALLRARLAHRLPSAAVDQHDPGSGVATFGNSLSKYYWMMAGIVLWHVAISLFDGNVFWLAQLGRSGVIYMLLQGVFIAALLSVNTGAAHLRRLMLAVGIAVAMRMLWGGIRFVFLGGDPASFYETDGGQNLRLTFWDINDSVWAVMLGTVLLWYSATARSQSIQRRLASFLFALFCFGIVSLSARRTAQLGAMLALLTLLAMLPRGRRWPILVVALIALPLAVYQFQARMSDSRSLVEKLLDEQQQRQGADPRYKRFYELRAAWPMVERHPWLGVGPAGWFEPPSHVGLEYHKGNYGFVHSGFGHVLLKTGVIGLLVFIGVLGAYVRLLFAVWRAAPSAYRGLLAGSAAGLAAGLPNLLIGTPLIEMRTMLVMGFGMAVPLLVARATLNGGLAGEGSIDPVVQHSPPLVQVRQ